MTADTLEFLVDVAIAFPWLQRPIRALVFRELDENLANLLGEGTVREIEEALVLTAEITPDAIADLREVLAQEYGTIEDFVLDRDRIS